MGFLVYAQVCPLTGRIRYVGRSKERTASDAIAAGRHYHFDDLRRPGHVWRAGLEERGLEPVGVELQRAASEAEAEALKAEWVAILESRGHELFNTASFRRRCPDPETRWAWDNGEVRPESRGE